MGIKLPTEPNFRTICTIGRDEAKALLNIFDCMADNENGYDNLENLLEYRMDNALANLEQVKEELENYVAKKKEDAFRARVDAAVEDKIEGIRLGRAWAIGE